MSSDSRSSPSVLAWGKSLLDTATPQSQSVMQRYSSSQMDQPRDRDAPPPRPRASTPSSSAPPAPAQPQPAPQPSTTGRVRSTSAGSSTYSNYAQSQRTGSTHSAVVASTKPQEQHNMMEAPRPQRQTAQRDPNNKRQNQRPVAEETQPPPRPQYQPVRGEPDHDPNRQQQQHQQQHDAEELRHILNATVVRGKQREEELLAQIKDLTAELAKRGEQDRSYDQQLVEELQDAHKHIEMLQHELEAANHNVREQSRHQSLLVEATRRLEDSEATKAELQRLISKLEKDEKLAGTAVVRLTDHIASVEATASHLHSSLRNVLRRLGIDEEPEDSDGNALDVIGKLAYRVVVGVESVLARIEVEAAKRESIFQVLQESHKDAQSRLEEQCQTIDEAHRAVMQLHSEKQRMEKEVEQAHQTAATAQATSEVAERTHAELQEQIDAGKAELRRMLTEMDSLRDETEHAVKEMEIARQETEHWKAMHQRERLETNKVREQMHTASKERVTAEDRCRELEQSISDLKRAAEEHSLEVARLSRQATERDTAVSQLRQEKHSWEMRLKSKEEDLQALTSERNALKDAIVSLEGDVVQFRDAESELRRLKVEHDGVKSERDAARDAHAAALRDVEYFRLLLTESKPNRAQSDVVAAPVEGEVVNLMKDNRVLRKQIAELREALQEEKKLSNERVKYTSRSVASIGVMTDPVNDPDVVSQLEGEVHQLKEALEAVLEQRKRKGNIAITSAAERTHENEPQIPLAPPSNHSADNIARTPQHTYPTQQRQQQQQQMVPQLQQQQTYLPPVEDREGTREVPLTAFPPPFQSTRSPSSNTHMTVATQGITQHSTSHRVDDIQRSVAAVLERRRQQW